MNANELIKKYGGIKLSPKFLEMIMRLDDPMRERVLQYIKTYRDQIIDAIKSGVPIFELMRNVYAGMNYAKTTVEKLPPGQTIQCRKGCAACCHIQVSITDIEARAIWAYCAKHGIDIDLDYLKSQHSLNEQSHAVAENSACVFLNLADNSCRIYEMRPAGCRKYHVVSDPAFCDAKQLFKHEVLLYLNIDQEIISSAIYSAARENDSIARILLKTKPPIHET